MSGKKSKRAARQPKIAYKSEPGGYFHIRSNLSERELFDTRKHPTLALLGNKLIERFENIYPDFRLELDSLGRAAPLREIFVSSHDGKGTSSIVQKDGDLIIDEWDCNVTWAGTYMLHVMNALAPSDPRKVKTKYELIPKPGLLGTSVRLFAERNLTRHGILDWPFNQSRPTNIANRFVESTNEAFLNLASVSLLRSVGFGVLGNYYGPLTEEDFVFAADAYVVDRLLASERAPFTATLRTLALEFAVLFARGYMSDKPGELPSAQRRIMRIVEELEVTHEIVIPDDDPFWRILCLGVVILCGDAYWNEWMKPYRELFEAFASAKQ